MGISQYCYRLANMAGYYNLQNRKMSYHQIDPQLFESGDTRLPGTFLNQSSDTKIKVKIGQNLKIKSTVGGLMCNIIILLHLMYRKLHMFSAPLLTPTCKKSSANYE